MEYVAEPSVIVSKLIRAVEGENLLWNDCKRWTDTIKQALRSQLESQVTEVLYTDTERRISEFLLDIVAWNRDNGEGMILAAECEWLQSPSEVVKDFEKLQVVKSPTKLMIFGSENAKNGLDIRRALENSLLLYKHHVVGERYLFVDFARGSERRAWWLQITSAGRMVELPEGISLWP